MATDISSYVNKIKNAIYGRDVRSAIVSAIQKINDDNNKYDALKAEVVAARDTTVARSQQAIDAVTNAQSLITQATSKNTTLSNTIKTATTKTTALNTAISKGEATIQDIDSAVEDAMDAKRLGNLLYPVGSIYISVNATNPGTVFGGTWEQIKDRFLLAAGTKYKAGATSGSADAIVPEHTHAIEASSSSAGAHTHTTSGTAASGGAHTHTTSGTAASAGAHTHAITATAAKTGEAAAGKNMPPYLAVYVWKRTK